MKNNSFNKNIIMNKIRNIWHFLIQIIKNITENQKYKLITLYSSTTTFIYNKSKQIMKIQHNLLINKYSLFYNLLKKVVIRKLQLFIIQKS